METVWLPSHEEKVNTCNKCSEKAIVHLTCFNCGSIYHPKCLLKAPTVYVNEEGHIFCCQNLTSNCNSFESESQTQENKPGKCDEEGACGSDDGFEKTKLEQDEYENDDICDAAVKKEEILEQLDRNGVRFLVDAFVHYLCPETAEFHQEDSYREHMKLNDNHLWLNETQDAVEKFEKMYKCDKCSYVSQWQYAMKSHSSIHSLEKQYKCTFKRCKCSQSLDTSMVKQCDCSMCEYKTNSKKYLRRHILQNHSGKGKKHKCGYCTYSTSNKSSLSQHKCTRPSEKSFKCDRCEFETVYNASLLKHILLKHSNVEKRYKCNNCKSSFHEKSHLTKHMRIHSSGKFLKCHECEYETAFKSQLMVHKSAKHNFGGKYYTCEICGLATVFKSNLKKHIARKHSKEKIQLSAKMTHKRPHH